MSNAKITPWPWKFLKRGMLVTQDETKIIGTFHKANDNNCDDELLIAAAPELLEALEAWEKAIPRLDEFASVSPDSLRGKALAAISKARGE